MCENWHFVLFLNHFKSFNIDFVNLDIWNKTFFFQQPVHVFITNNHFVSKGDLLVCKIRQKVTFQCKGCAGLQGHACNWRPIYAHKQHDALCKTTLFESQFVSHLFQCFSPLGYFFVLSPDRISLLNWFVIMPSPFW